MHGWLTRVGPPAVELLVLAAIGLVCVRGPGGSAMAAMAPDAEDCVGPGCENGIACDRAAAAGPATSSRPVNLPVAVAFGVGRDGAPEQTWAPAMSPPSPTSAGPSLARIGPRSPPTV
ncbi:MAG: hypothetical protein K6T92_02235 [Candidatus Rokubacteria bacterium]|nr:hypothetical protein [Candidatus Rokubacteria bacterium]